jgi:hypothetical protein
MGVCDRREPHDEAILERDSNSVVRDLAAPNWPLSRAREIAGILPELHARRRPAVDLRREARIGQPDAKTVETVYGHVCNSPRRSSEAEFRVQRHRAKLRSDFSC